MTSNAIFFSVGTLSLIFSGISLYFFRKKIINAFDPLTLFLIMRLSTLLAATFIILRDYSFNFTVGLYLMSVLIFVLTFFILTKKVKFENIIISKKEVKFLTYVAFAFLILKMSLIYTSTGSLPIFSDGGSDASIDFNESNKVSTSLLSGMGSGELFILAFTIPFVAKKNMRFLIYCAFVISILLILASGKKTSLFSVGAIIFFADGFRALITNNKKLYFFNLRNIIFLIIASGGWAVWVFLNTSLPSEGSLIELNAVVPIIDFIFSQWTTPYFLFNSTDFYDFLNYYKVNQFTYFFHSILKPLGFPAFDASIGPALHEYQTGNLSGNGINPSFVLEGYVLFGAGVPIYAMIAAFVIAKARNKLLSIKRIEYKIIFVTMYMSSIYAIASDGLLFVKAFWASIIIFIFVVIPIRLMVYKKV
jgi:oligosaccharide repeat unit polymerase